MRGQGRSEQAVGDTDLAFHPGLRGDHIDDPLGRWPGADIELDCRAEAWHGAEAGHGRLRSREVVVRAVGRGAAARPRTARLLLPGPGGPVEEMLADLTIKAVG